MSPRRLDGDGWRWGRSKPRPAFDADKALKDVLDVADEARPRDALVQRGWEPDDADFVALVIATRGRDGLLDAVLTLQKLEQKGRYRD